MAFGFHGHIFPPQLLKYEPFQANLTAYSSSLSDSFRRRPF